MRRSFLFAACGVLCGAVLLAAAPLWAALGDDIISESVAQRCGLTRAWVTHAQVNAGQERLQSIVLYDGTLFAQTSRATIEAIDAETGQRLWSKRIGQADYPTLPVGACKDLVATTNGSRLFVLNRYTGDILYQIDVDGVPGGSTALSTKRAYVPTSSGMIYSYRLDPVTDAAKELGKINLNLADMTDEEREDAAKKAEEERRENIRIRQDYVPPLACASDGRAMTPPIVTTQTREEEFVTWVTDKGRLQLGRVDRRSGDSLLIKFRLNANGPFSNSPAYLPPGRNPGDAGLIFAGSSDNYVYAVSESDGEIRWKFSAGEPVIDSPVLIADRIYATTDLGGMFVIEAKTGKQIWWAPEIMHFVAAGRQRVYATDTLGRLRILDARSGATLDVLPTNLMPIKVANNQTDRIYLATETGLLQCLHEVDAAKPIVYNLRNKLKAETDLADKPLPKLKSKLGDSVPVPAKAPTKKPTKAEDADAGDAADKPTKPTQSKPATKTTTKEKAKSPDDDLFPSQ